MNSILKALLFIGLSIYHLNADVDCGTITYKTHLSNQSFYQQKLNVPATDRLEIDYNITFKTDTCCPVVAFENTVSLARNNTASEKQCYEETNFFNIVPYSMYFIYGVHWLSSSGCQIVNDTYICTGTRKLYIGTITEWWIDVGYKCNEEHQLSMDIELQLNCTFPHICEELTLDFCKTKLGYTQVAFPNALGQTSQVEANRLFEIVLGVFRRAGSCHQHALEYICYSLFPKCSNRGPYLPCKRSCDEFVAAFDGYLIRFRQTLYCGAFPDTLEQDMCYYKPIQCPQLQDPRYGRLVQRGNSLFNTTEYFCMNGYKVEGNAIRYCGYNGLWNSTAPTCVPQRKPWIVAGPIIGVFSLCVIIALLVIYAYRSDKIHDFIRYYDSGGSNSYRVNQQEKQMFLTYSSDDRERVEDNILHKMKLELPGWNILTYQESFVGGDSLIKSIEMGIWESHAVLAFMTPNFVQSEFCKYEFREAQTRVIREDGFKFIIIFDEGHGMNSLYNDMPVSMRTWLKTRLYLTIGEYKFWEKLRRGLSSKFREGK